ncbi:serine/threonine protein phosphatase [Bacteroides fragilis]|uniref:Serine/threonine protein phosphatase n=1 Tax=Bacteroides fragilis TaxID=817 RepID=A0A396C1C3_BACFG|nr:metallophosphoesterase [Bacteroides fragilis]RHH14378.1 serine/threonine protein phosphatase [Bacteroides fragilis]
MKIAYASDLHLEFADNSKFLKEHPLSITGEVLVLAGDIGYLEDDNYSKHPFWSWAADNYNRVIIIPGNHELYKGFDINTLHNGWEFKIRSNVSCYYNTVIQLGDTDLIATTLWSKIRLEDAFQTEAAITDFKRIRNGDETLDWVRFNEEHSRCFQFLNESVKNSKAKHIIVISHHVPSFELNAREFKGSNLNGAFTVELGRYIAESPINYWIYGHSHRNINKTIGRTQCVTNQLGYVFANEHLSFNPKAYIELE